MGHYLNPGDEGFKRALRARIYVDKSEIIGYVNSVLGTDECCRFDKDFNEVKDGMMDIFSIMIFIFTIRNRLLMP